MFKITLRISGIGSIIFLSIQIEFWVHLTNNYTELSVGLNFLYVE